MNKRDLLILAVFTLVFSACTSQPSEASIQTAIAETQSYELLITQVWETEIAKYPTETHPPTNTPVPSPTPIPPTDVPHQTGSQDSTWARNYLGSTQSGDVVIEVVRVLAATKEHIDRLYKDDGGWNELGEYALDKVSWDTADGALEIIIRIINNSTVAVETGIHCWQSSVQVGGGQINISDTKIILGGMHTDCTSPIWPNSEVFAGVWVPLNNIAPEEINSIILRIPPPRDHDSYDELGDWFVIEMDVSEHRWEEMPEELN